MEDLSILVLIGGGGGLILGPVIPGIAAICGWILLLRFKRDKPQGYVLHWLYMQGSSLPGLIPPPSKVKRYGAYASCHIKKFKVR